MNSPPSDGTPTDLVETVLHDNGARTERERHDDTDIRVLATLE